MKYEDIKFFSERCEEHPDHQSGMISNSMIQQRLYEEIDELREYIEETLKDKNMKSEQIKHSLAVGPKSIQSRVFDRETDEVISFVKIPIKDSGLVRCEWIELTDEEIEGVYQSLQLEDYIRKQDRIDFARAILRKTQEK